ncbi:hypothetical protein D3C86_1679060 [compost metagenome]
MPHLQDIGVFENGFRRQGVEIAATTLTCVVHQHVDPAPGVCNFSHERLDPVTVGDVDNPGNDRLGMLRELFCGFAHG